MILFLSSSFLNRLRSIWKPTLKAFLIGDRNLFFFTPDYPFEVEEISPARIDSFLQKNASSGEWQLLGFLAPDELPPFLGYAQMNTHGSFNPETWTGQMTLLGSDGPEQKKLEIKFAVGAKHLPVIE